MPFAPLADRYSIIGKLRGTGRAEVSIGLPMAARSSDELVVIKTYEPPALDGAGSDDGVEMPPELEVASTPRHDNLARVFECGWRAGRHFIVSEYLEGRTLRRLLRWLSVRSETLPDAAVARILLGLFSAVEHANQWARTAPARALVHRPIDASDVFITYAGEVKVLGFKPPRAGNAALDGEPAAEPRVELAAVDELLSTQRSPALGAALARIGNRVSAASLIGLWQVARMLKDWQQNELGSDGLAELAGVMAKVQPEARAARRQQLDVAVARVVRARDEADAASDTAPVSGFRAASPNEAAIIRLEPPRPELEAPLAPFVGAAEAVSHLQRVRLLPPPLRALPPPLPPTAAAAPPPPALGSPPTSALVTQGPPLIPPEPAPTPRHRSIPWPSLVMLAGALAAALAVARHRGERPASARQAVAAAAPAPLATRAAPSVAPSSAAIGVSSARANEPSPVRASDSARPKPAGAPARTARPPGEDPVSSSAPRRNPRESRVGSASIARGASPEAAPGFLTLDTTPWSAVSAGGTLLGQTPLVKVELPPGQHLLDLANEELGIATSVMVEITSGATTVRRIGLERPIHAARQ